MAKLSYFRHLQLPLVDSERSWAFAMECKAELDGPKAGLMRQAMLRRLSKASAHAATFSKFAAARADPRCRLSQFPQLTELPELLGENAIVECQKISMHNGFT